MATSKDIFDITYIKRNNFKRFDTLEPDEQIIASWALAYKELVKFNFSAFYDIDMDDESVEDQMKVTSSDKKGGIDYKNFMFPDRYDDEDKKFDTIENQYYAVMSIFEVLQKYGLGAGDWPGVVCLLGKWYERNIHTYQSGTSGHAGGGRKFYTCDLFPGGRQVGDDCTSFCWACINLYYATAMKGKDPVADSVLANHTYPPTSSTWGNRFNQDALMMDKLGFEIIPYSLSALQPWDMVMGSTLAGATHGHGEIYIGMCNGRIRSFGWGNIHDGQNGHGGMPAGAGGYKLDNEYSLIFRLKGIKKMSQQEVEKIVNQYA